MSVGGLPLSEIKEIITMSIKLIEDNAGGLFIGPDPDSGAWHVMTDVQESNTFADDAAALAAGDTADWTTELLDKRPIGKHVATWENGNVHFMALNFGKAANMYLADKGSN